MISWEIIQRITQGRFGRTMAVCPLCSAGRHSQLSAASEPPLSVIEELRRHKLEIVELLRSKRNHSEAPSTAPFGEVIAKLRSKRPDHVEPDRWRQAVQDAERFLIAWGEQAHVLGWTARELFGLHTVPAHPAASYSRLSRYDETGLIWLLCGRPVVAMTDSAATIRCPGGNTVTFRRCP